MKSRMPVRVRLWKRPPVVVDPLTAPYVEGEPLPAGDPCPNCGDRTPGRFCRHCGQARRVVHVSLREMLADFLDDQLALNSTLPRTVACLLVRPGYLTQAYLRGRIASYIRPLRLYVGSSVLFFLVFAFAARLGNWVGGELELGNGDGAVRVTRVEPGAMRRQADSLRVAARGDLPPGARGLPVPPPAPVAPRPAVVNGAQIFHGMGALGDTLNVKFLRLKRMEPAQRRDVLLDAVQEQLPRMMFVLLPVFALLLKLLYLRSGRFYVEHFVFALHFHAFVFLLLTLLIGVETGVGPAAAPAGPVAVGWIYLYLFLAMKKVYGQGFFRTGLKYVALLFGYFVMLIMGGLVSLLAFVYFL